MSTHLAPGSRRRSKHNPRQKRSTRKVRQPSFSSWEKRLQQSKSPAQRQQCLSQMVEQYLPILTSKKAHRHQRCEQLTMLLFASLRDDKALDVSRTAYTLLRRFLPFEDLLPTMLRMYTSHPAQSQRTFVREEFRSILQSEDADALLLATLGALGVMIPGVLQRGRGAALLHKGHATQEIQALFAPLRELLGDKGLRRMLKLGLSGRSTSRDFMKAATLFSTAVTTQAVWLSPHEAQQWHAKTLESLHSFSPQTLAYARQSTWQDTWLRDQRKALYLLWLSPAHKVRKFVPMLREVCNAIPLRMDTSRQQELLQLVIRNLLKVQSQRAFVREQLERRLQHNDLWLLKGLLAESLPLLREECGPLLPSLLPRLVRVSYWIQEDITAAICRSRHQIDPFIPLLSTRGVDQFRHLLLHALRMRGEEIVQGAFLLLERCGHWQTRSAVESFLQNRGISAQGRLRCLLHLSPKQLGGDPLDTKLWQVETERLLTQGDSHLRFLEKLEELDMLRTKHRRRKRIPTMHIQQWQECYEAALF